MCAPQCQILCSHASWFWEESAFLPCFVSSLRPMPGNSTMRHTEAEKENSQQRGGGVKEQGAGIYQDSESTH